LFEETSHITLNQAKLFTAVTEKTETIEQFFLQGLNINFKGKIVHISRREDYHLSEGA